MNQQRPRLTTEIRSSKQHIFVLAGEVNRFVAMLKRKLESFDNEVTVASSLPHSLKPYVTCIFFDVKERVFKDIIAKHDNHLVFIFFDNRELAQTCAGYVANDTRHHTKVINLETSFDYYDEDIDTIFWFSFSRNKEIFLPVHHAKPASLSHPAQTGAHTQSTTTSRRLPRKRTPLNWHTLASLFRPRNTITAIIGTILLIHLMFLPALALASFYHYKAVTSLRNGNADAAKGYLANGTKTLGLSRALYSYVRPTFSLFSLAILPDNAFLLNQSLNRLIVNGLNVRSQANEFMELFFLPDKSSAQVEYMSQLKNSIIDKAEEMDQDIALVHDKMPVWTDDMKKAKDELKRTDKMLGTVSQFAPYIDTIMAKGKQKKYLVLFANNMELRPGGGFIGSFGVITVGNYTIKNIQVYDVYDADGQLTAHIRPPSAIRDYLDQPHWFLRDSAFSPDFSENYAQAKFFLEKTLDMKGFDGVVLITTTAIQNLLSSMDDLYLPDFRETVNGKNFYIKAQLYAEKDFFPGSRQKKTFLSSVMNQLLIELPESQPLDLVEAMKKSLDEKQIVVSFDDRALQKTIDSMYWSGRTIKPNCTSPSPNCIPDYLFPYDANLGVNKANFFVSKTESLEVSIKDDGTISHKLSMNYKNDSYEDIFPGGRYKNYLQILLPQNVRIKRITENGKIISNYDLQGSDYTRIGFLSEILPKETSAIVVEYDIKRPIAKGSGTYQLILQKQIGSANSDFRLSLELPKNIYVVNKNFSPIVKDGKILYNTSLSADKIFFIEFFKE